MPRRNRCAIDPRKPRFAKPLAIGLCGKCGKASDLKFGKVKCEFCKSITIIGRKKVHGQGHA
jgi:hypothetical protein